MALDSNLNMQDSGSFLKISNRLFFATLIGQSVLAFAVLVFATTISMRGERAETQKKIASSFHDYEKRITEAVYIDDILKSGRSSTDAILAEFKATLNQSDISADVQVLPCNLEHSGARIPLNLGSRRLSQCLTVEAYQKSIFDRISLVLLLMAIAFLVLAVGWLVARKYFNQRLIVPMAEELAEKSRQSALSEVAVQVAHDIKSPLSLITAIASAYQGPLDEDVRALLISAVKRINGTADDLLTQRRTIAVSISKQTVSEDEKFDLEASLNQIIAEKQILFGNKITLSFDPNMGRSSIKGSATEFANLISNILNNSIEASPQTGITIKVADLKESIEVKVSDLGPGFPSEILESAGKTSVTLGKIDGNGLGLLGAHRTLQKLGGSISLRNRRDRGAEVSIRLPAVQ